MMAVCCKRFVSLAMAGAIALMLSACVGIPAPLNLSHPQTIPAEDLTASVMRVGYRFKRAGEADQFIMPPERFVITAIDDVPVTMTTTSNVALPVSAGKHSITIAASGGLLAAENSVNATIGKNKTYQVTGWLNNHGPPVFVVWVEDSETGRPVSPKTPMYARHR